MRLVLIVTAVVALVVGAGTARTAAPVGQPVFVLTGGGWGHGVGMSQWGAYGQARAGRTRDQILRTYYRGIALQTATPRTVRVLVRQSSKPVAITSAGTIRIRDAAGVVVELPEGAVTLGPDLTLEVEGTPTSLTGPVQVLATGGALLSVGSTTYRGKLVITGDGTQATVVNAVGLELYLQGVVPGEVPSGWPASALEAQAIAARTYALVSIVKGKPFDLYSDWRSQVYYGAGEETPSTTKAVRATRGTIVTYGGLPAQTLYFSSSGGRTRSAVDVYGSDVPYLVAVDDPWDAVPANPNHRWTPVTLTGVKLAQQVGVKGRVSDVVVTTGSDGRPGSVAFITASGVTKRVPARDLRTLLKLRSTSFRLGVLRLDPLQEPAAGMPFAITGAARDVDEPRLERLTDTGVWTTVRQITPRADGTFRVFVRPGVTTTYRLAAADAAGPALTITVDGTTA